MDAATVAVDLAKSVFQVAEADARGHITGSHRLTRTQFERFFANRAVGQVVMEACGSAHHWARSLQRQGVAVRLLPAAHVQRFCLRNKTDAADCMALLRANGDPKIRDVRIKSVEQQALQALHRTRSQWMATRVRRINALREFCREFGLPVAVGARTGLHAISRLVTEPASCLPALLRPANNSDQGLVVGEESIYDLLSRLGPLIFITERDRRAFTCLMIPNEHLWIESVGRAFRNKNQKIACTVRGYRNGALRKALPCSGTAILEDDMAGGTSCSLAIGCVEDGKNLPIVARGREFAAVPSDKPRAEFPRQFHSELSLRCFDMRFGCWKSHRAPRAHQHALRRNAAACPCSNDLSRKV